jgi:hypothetical protein
MTTEEKAARCLELSRRPGSDTEYWLRKMDEALDELLGTF